MRDTALILIGHGSKSREDPSYLRFLEEVRALYPETYLVMLLGDPSPSRVLETLKEKGFSKALFFPLFLSSGAHVRRDIVSESAPLFQAFAAAGIRPSVLSCGLLDEPKVRAALMEICLEGLEKQECC